jgi:uncharacterized membrane protein YvbJ
LKQSPRYFCDNCGTEVFSDDRACPRCGRLFVSVRCPNCGYSGEDKRFQNGCPLCGYSDPNAGKGNKPSITKPKKKKSKVKHQHEPLPIWGYAVMGAALLILVLLLSHLITL